MGRGFAKLLKKARRNRITIIAVNSSGGSTRSVTLPVLAAAVVILVSVGLFASMIGSYAVMRSSLIQSTASHEIKDTRIERLVSENTELRMIVSAQSCSSSSRKSDPRHGAEGAVYNGFGQEIIDTRK